MGKGKYVVVCLSGAIIEHVAERVEQITGRGNGGSIMIHIGTIKADEEGTTAIVEKYRNLRKMTKQARIQELEEDGHQRDGGAALQGRESWIRGFVGPLCGERRNVRERWPAS